ncbi:MAG: hypothetical protein IBJ09_01535 [Bacteroidia bacterium]|nr:hypothetical protein [Bacteroidia bacterium]
MKKIVPLFGFLLMANAVLHAQKVSSCEELPQLFRKKNAEYAPEIKRTVTDSCLPYLTRVLKNKKYTELRIEFSALPDSAFWNILPPELEFLSVSSVNGYAGLPASLGGRVYQLELFVKDRGEALSLPAAFDVPVLQLRGAEADSFRTFVYGRASERRELLIDEVLYRSDSAGWNAFLRRRSPNYTTPQAVTSSVENYAGGLLPYLRGGNEQAIRFSAETGDYLPLGRGQFVHIPFKSLTLHGRAYTGEVVLRYRSWTSMEDMMNAGLPMWTQLPGSGDTLMFRTAGMFEMRAFTPSGDTLEIKEGRNLELIFPKTDETLSSYTYYEFDEKGNVWNDKGRVGTRIILGTVMAAEMRSGRKRPRGIDTRLWDERFADLNTTYKLDSGKRRGSAYWLDMDGKRYQVNGRINQFKMVPEVVTGRDGNAYTRILSSGRLPDHMREIGNVLRYTWLRDYMPEKEFRRKYVRGKKYHDIDIIDRGEGYFTLVLKHRKGFEELDMLTYQPWRRVTSGLKGTAARRVAFMTERLGRKERTFNWRMAERQRSFVQRTGMTPGMQNADTLDGVYYGRNLLGQSVKIGVSDFGLINCDQEYKMKDKQNFLGTFYDGNSLLDVSHVQVADRYARGFFTYRVRVGEEKLAFSLSPQNTTAVFVTTKDEKLYVFKDENLQKMYGDLKAGSETQVREQIRTGMP